MIEILIGADQNLEILIKPTSTMLKLWENKSFQEAMQKNPKMKNEDDSANAVTEEVQDALLLAVDNPLDD